MIAEDSVYIPFPETVLKQVEPITTIDLIIPYNTSVKGCQRRCPCRLWVNCHYYNKAKYKESRNDDEIYKEIWEYFNNTFKLKIETPECYPNG